jgi:hypothetical protein
VMKCDKEKGKGRLGDEVWQRERKRKIGWWSVATRKERGEYAMKILQCYFTGTMNTEINLFIRLARWVRYTLQL